MAEYLNMVLLLNFIVDLLLLLGTNRLAGFPGCLWRSVLGAALGALHACACLLPGFGFLGNLLWRVVSLGLSGWIAFGFSVSGLQRCVLYEMLSMALGGITASVHGGGFWRPAVGAVILCVLCAWLSGSVGRKQYVDVELCYGQKKVRLLALRDTGNTLTDPVTGSSVLVVGADAARQLLGIEKNKLLTPVETVASGCVPGARLIPYRSVGQQNGMLLGLRLANVRIGSWQGSTVVAFAPHGLDQEGTYQALTGGMV